MTKYINIKNQYGIETIDELQLSDFTSYKEFRKELQRLLNEYMLVYTNVYISQRCSLDWHLKY